VKNILLISSKKNIKNKNTRDIISYLKKIKIPYTTIDTDVEDISTLKISKETLLVSLGGDGTVLKAMKIAWLNKLDVLPLGSGRIGYLVNSKENFKSIIDEWKINKHSYAKRKAIIQNNNHKFPAFNEVVVIKNSPSRLLDLSIETYDQKVNLRSDGLIISTSLGSTAYNYSAGGPIIHNDIDSIVVTPISPFSKFPRSIVLSGKSKLILTISKNQNYAIQFDGIMEVQEKNETNLTFEYKLSSKSINLVGQNNNPKIDLFLNQILR
tara:strand:+ start:1759 stop:2559 length:801 start_codon:yes stop_codon:yes gene_type:complete